MGWSILLLFYNNNKKIFNTFNGVFQFSRKNILVSLQKQNKRKYNTSSLLNLISICLFTALLVDIAYLPFLKTVGSRLYNRHSRFLNFDQYHLKKGAEIDSKIKLLNTSFFILHR